MDNLDIRFRNIADLSEIIGHDIADRLDNLLAAMDLPLPPKMHLDSLRGNLREIRDTAREVVVLMTGENPWSDA